MEREEGVFAELEETENGVEHVLVGAEGVHADSEGENELMRVSTVTLKQRRI